MPRNLQRPDGIRRDPPKEGALQSSKGAGATGTGHPRRAGVCPAPHARRRGHGAATEGHWGDTGRAAPWPHPLSCLPRAPGTDEVGNLAWQGRTQLGLSSREWGLGVPPGTLPRLAVSRARGQATSGRRAGSFHCLRPLPQQDGRPLPCRGQGRGLHRTLLDPPVTAPCRLASR